MKLATRCLIFALIISGSFCTYAQGYCPPGQYPVAGQGWSYCAGVPDSQEAPADAPKPKWINKWLALTVDKDKAILSTATSSESANAAVAISMQDCQNKGGTACDNRVTVLNGCLAMAVGSGFLASGAGATKNEAEAQALGRCEGGDVKCRIYHSECAPAEREH